MLKIHQKKNENRGILTLIVCIIIIILFMFIMYFRNSYKPEKIYDFLLKDYSEFNREINELRGIMDTVDCSGFYYLSYTKSGMYSFIYCKDSSNSFKENITLSSGIQSYLIRNRINRVSFLNDNLWIDYRKRDYKLNKYYLVNIKNEHSIINNNHIHHY